MMKIDDGMHIVNGECSKSAEFAGSLLEVSGKRFKNYFLPGFSVEIQKNGSTIFAADMEFFLKNELRSQEEAVGFCDSESAEWGETAYQLFRRRKKSYPMDAIALCEDMGRVDLPAMRESPGLLAACLDLALQTQRALYPRQKCQYMAYFGNPGLLDLDKDIKALCKRDKVAIVECTHEMAVVQGCYLVPRKASEANAKRNYGR